jgi:hypothetical protein
MGVQNGRVQNGCPKWVSKISVQNWCQMLKKVQKKLAKSWKKSWKESWKKSWKKSWKNCSKNNY